MLERRSGGERYGYWAGAVVLVRAAPYGVRSARGGRPRGRPPSPTATVASPMIVICYCASPFAGEENVVYMYFGGPDTNTFPLENTAWIYMGKIVEA